MAAQTEQMNKTANRGRKVSSILAHMYEDPQNIELSNKNIFAFLLFIIFIYMYRPGSEFLLYINIIFSILVMFIV